MRYKYVFGELIIEREKKIKRNKEGRTDVVLMKKSSGKIKR